MKNTVLPGEFEVWLMLNDPRTYAAEALQDMRNVMHVSLQEGPQLGTGFHEAAGLAKAELNRKRSEAYRHEAERLTMFRSQAPQCLQDIQETAARVLPSNTIADQAWRRAVKKQRDDYEYSQMVKDWPKKWTLGRVLRAYWREFVELGAAWFMGGVK